MLGYNLFKIGISNKFIYLIVLGPQYSFNIGLIKNVELPYKKLMREEF